MGESTVVGLSDLPGCFWRQMREHLQHPGGDCIHICRVGDFTSDITLEVSPPGLVLLLDGLNTSRHEATHDGFARDAILLQLLNGFQQLLNFFILPELFG